MAFAAYADVGAGLAFLLLLALSGLGLAVLLVRTLSAPRALRGPTPYAALVGLLQAWALYLCVRFGVLSVPRRTLEWLWLGSLLIVVASVAAFLVIGRPRAAARKE